MAGEQSKFDLSREEFPFHYALADRLGVEVEPFDVYQGPYVASEQGRIFLCTEDGAVCTWYNDWTRNSSSEFLTLASKTEGYEPAILGALVAAEEIVKFPPMVEFTVVFEKHIRVLGEMEFSAPNGETARRIVNELMDQFDDPLRENDERVVWNTDPEYIDETFAIHKII